nr:hypothetical protein [Nakamurella sp. PAMC28650]
MFWIHMSCIGSETGAPCTPTLALVPPDEGYRRQEGLGISDRLDGHVHPETIGHREDFGDDVRSDFHGIGGTHLERLLQPELVGVDRDDPGGTEEPGGQDRGQPDGAGTDDGHRVAGLHTAGEDADLVSGRKGVGEEDGLLVRNAAGDRVQRGVGVGDTDQLRLRAVDQVAEDPADASDALAV